MARLTPTASYHRALSRLLAQFDEWEDIPKPLQDVWSPLQYPEGRRSADRRIENIHPVGGASMRRNL